MEATNYAQRTISKALKDLEATAERPGANAESSEPSLAKDGQHDLVAPRPAIDRQSTGMQQTRMHPLRGESLPYGNAPALDRQSTGPPHDRPPLCERPGRRLPHGVPARNDLPTSCWPDPDWPSDHRPPSRRHLPGRPRPRQRPARAPPPAEGYAARARNATASAIPNLQLGGRSGSPLNPPTPYPLDRPDAELLTLGLVEDTGIDIRGERVRVLTRDGLAAVSIWRDLAASRIDPTTCHGDFWYIDILDPFGEDPTMRGRPATAAATPSGIRTTGSPSSCGG